MKSNNLTGRPERQILLFVTALGGGALVGWTAHRNAALEARWRDLSREVETLAQDPARPPGVGSCVATVDSRAIAEEVRRVLREAPGAAAVTNGAEPSPKAEAELEPPPPTTEVLETLKRGQDLVARARGNGHWTTEDALATRDLMAELDDATRMQLHLEIVQAINRQELKLDTPLMF